MNRLPLLVDVQDDRVFLRSPEVGTFTRALSPGALVAPKASCGSLRQLSTTFELVVPDGVAGRVVSPRPDLIHHPVGYGDVLYELAPLEADGGAGFTTLEAAGASGAPAFRAPYSGRFWHRPSPQDPAFVEEGAEMQEGSTVGLLEVMKTFTQLTYTNDGGLPARARITKLLAADGDEVSEGDPLFELEAR